MGLSGRVKANIYALLGGTVDIGGANWQADENWEKTFTDGAGIDQANKVFQDKITLAGSGVQTYDLDSALVGPLGTVTFSRIYAICIRRTDAPVASTQDENVALKGDFILTKLLIPAGDTLTNMYIPIRPGGEFIYVCPDATGVAITASTGDELTLTNISAGDTCNLDVIILGS